VRVISSNMYVNLFPMYVVSSGIIINRVAMESIETPKAIHRFVLNVFEAVLLLLID